MTVGWYLAGGIASALAYRLLAKRPDNSSSRTRDHLIPHARRVAG